MAFTEKDLDAQIEAFNALKEEFSRLEAEGEQMKKNLGVTSADLVIDFDALSPQEKEFVAQAQENAKRAGAERVGQNSNTTTSSTAKAPGAGRRNAIRL